VANIHPVNTQLISHHTWKKFLKERKDFADYIEKKNARKSGQQNVFALDEEVVYALFLTNKHVDLW
jgi:predicted nucleic-acid-binding protein